MTVTLCVKTLCKSRNYLFVIMVGSNFGIIYHPSAGGSSGQANTSGGVASSALGNSGNFASVAGGDRSAPASHLSDFMLQLEDYTPLLPDAGWRRVK